MSHADSSTAPTAQTNVFGAIEQKLQAMHREINKAVIGQREPVELILISLIAGGHVLLEGVPGLGKTLIVKAIAKTFGGDFSRIQFTPDLMPADVTGHMLFNPKEGEFSLRRGPVFTNLLLADEINRAPAKTQAALLEVMQEKQVTIEGESLPVTRPFMVLATQNPLEQEGTYPLPEAQLDRFLMKINLTHLSAAEEQQLMGYMLSLKQVMDIYTDELTQVINAEQLIKIQQATHKITVDERVIQYALDIVRKTRDFHGVAVGAGPRGGIALLACARAKALINGRSHVIPDDVKSLALPVLRHRIALTADVEIEGLTPDDILKQLMSGVDAPRQ
ncbi:AAA family ATPase [Ostreibacterium oceani]|uniref:AAA family ATPase n=1 Tax=Ostreibacterium oceani TaxID=2654998 RepID=UPI0038B32EB4